MLLYLVRHAHALKEEEDPKRPLSPWGYSQMERLVGFFRANACFGPAQLWHSPLLRSRQTAERLVAGLGFEGPVVETPGLLPDDDPDQLLGRLAAFTAAQPLAIVGHEPHLSALATQLVRGKNRPAAFVLKKAAVLALVRTDETHKTTGEPRWMAEWQVQPSLLNPPAGGTTDPEVLG